MKTKSLFWKTCIRLFICFNFMCFVGLTEMMAYDFTAVCPSGQTLYYRITSSTNHTVAFTCPNSANPWDGFPRPTGNIVLPTTVTYNDNTYTVTTIDESAFAACVGLTGDLVIPNTVTSIGNQAFDFCTGFNGTLTIPNSVIKIGEAAFYNCTGFTGDLVIPDSVIEISYSAFWNVGNTGSLILGNSLTTIYNSAFQECHFTGSLILPNSLTYIGASAFSDCTGFTGELVLPNSLTYLGGQAFKGCNHFTGDLVIPNSITSIYAYTFQGCSGFNGNLILPSNLTRMRTQAFQGCSNFKAIYVPNTNPPTVNSGALSGIPTTIPVYVPYCSLSEYASASGWSSFNYRHGSYMFVGDDNNTQWSNESNWVCGALPSENDLAIVLSDCDMNTAEANANSLIILKDAILSINPNCKLDVAGSIDNQGTTDNLVIEDGGELLHDYAGVNATVKKEIEAYSQNDGWFLIASPMTDTLIASDVTNLLSNNYDLYYYDQSEELEWRNIESQTFTIDNGVGYLYGNNQNVSLSFAGELKVGTQLVNIPLVYSDEADETLKGFNLIGNPYAHSITSYTSENVTNGCYRMNESNDNIIVTEISESNPIKPGEGFFVQATDVDASITFTGTTRSEEKRTGSISLNLTENGRTTDRLIVKRGEEDQNLAKLSLRDSHSLLYAMKDKQELSIVVCKDNEQPVNFKTAKKGTYTLNLTLNDMEVDYLHLIDNLTGDDIDLLATFSYTFEARPKDYASRFRLVFEPSAGTEVGNDSFAFINNGNFVISNEGIATLQVVDMTGRILSSETISNNFTKPVTLSNGVYILRLINGDQVKNQKIVVR